MAYITPSVLVYQQLEEAGGVLNTTPDLEAVIIGPLYQNVYVDPTNSISMEESLSYTISDWDTEQAAILAADGTATGFTLPLTNTYPGQNTDATSVSVHLSDTFVEINQFEIDLGFAGTDRSLVTIQNIAATTVDGSVALPDGTANHLNVGDKVSITYNPGGGDVTLDTYISSIVSSSQVRLADPVPELAAVTATATVYHLYSYMQLAASAFTTADIADEEVNLLFTANPFPSAPAHPNGYPSYGFLSGKVHVGYSALRVDTSATVLTLNDSDEILSQLGVSDENNPLALAVSLAKRNTSSYVKCLAVSSNDSAGFAAAAEILEGEERAYYLVPLTQEESIIQIFASHSKQMSTPEEGLWRVTLANTELPEVLYLLGDADVPITGTGTLVRDDVGTPTKIFLNDAQAFLGLGITPGDNIVISTATDPGNGDAPVPEAVGTFTVEDVRDNANIEVSGVVPTDIPEGTEITYYISRDLTKRNQAETIAATAEVFGSNRVWHIWPDKVGIEIDGVTKILPGYYLCAAHAGACSGFPVQQGMTNIALAGIVDLRNSNFYFSREDLGIMAEKGVCIYAQVAQGGLPYCRHALTTDVSVLEYREQLKVKNWDFLSYYFKDKIKPFIGSWNITPDTLSNMRQVTLASAELLVTQKLPKIGPPLLSYQIVRLEQNANNKDMVDVEIKIEIVSPNNYTNVYLVI